jgi:hypothetical protein
VSAYLEKLKDPRWQKVRLKVMERAGFKCECCENDKDSNGEPWDAPLETLECLCRSCHEWREKFNRFCELETGCDETRGRTLAPTKFCLAACRFAGQLYKPSKPVMQMFTVFWEFITGQR